MLKKLVGDKLAYTEEGQLDEKSGIYSLKTTPSVFPEKTTVAGQIRCEPRANGTSIDRVLSLKIEVRVFAVGSLAEEKIAEDVRRSYETGAAFTNEFLKR